MTPSRIVIEVLGRFDERVAQAVRSALVRGVEGLTIAFTPASKVDPVSLALLARELAKSRGQSEVVVEGLSQHHERLLRYLGARLPAPSSDPAAKA